MNLNLMKLCASALAVTAVTCGVERLQAAGNDACYSAFETYDGDDLELVVDAKGTHFALWSPEAQEAKVIIYPTDRNSTPVDTMVMTRGEKGVWRASVPDKLYGRFYTFSIKHNGKWLAETPGVWAKALGTNGERAAIIDFKTTDPEGWNVDKGPSIKNINDAVLYEMHHRDFSVHPSSGIVNKGKFLALTEHGTVSPAGDKTGILHNLC